ncbi:MAG: D-alanyl-D-alanine carboxypeptidase family protein [Verrucomicrobia bacterium]|nr:D-alanyl-D-alanine carboxypeptidase family protein [Verrucomicrobiota bacterium]
MTDIARLHRELGIPADFLSGRQPVREPCAGDLIQIGTKEDGHPILLEQSAAESWIAMCNAAERDGVLLEPVSGFRSVEYQAGLLRSKLEEGQPLDDILQVMAVPGYSEHHTGCAIDINTPGCEACEEEFEDSAAFAWLSKHAGAFGFTLSYPKNNPRGVIYEPWHWCYS